MRSPRLIVINEELCAAMGILPEDLRTPDAIALLGGNGRWPGSEPRATAYAGHQFGGFSGQLGDGRALLLGELPDAEGQLFEVQLKGSGPTPYSRGGDGLAGLGPVLREFLVSEAMHALGIPTTRALAAVATGEAVFRESTLPGAVLTRLATSFLRVGTFEYVSARRDGEALTQLVQFALARHPALRQHCRQEQVQGPDALCLLDGVIELQARLIAQWMGVGFIHGVMNTDNSSISGETIDYGPCAFMDAYDPARKFSSIDRGGRYAYKQQPEIAQWNLARLAESLLPLIDGEESRAVSMATDLLHQFPERYKKYYAEVCSAKLGLPRSQEPALGFMQELLSLMANAGADFTLTFRHLTSAVETGNSDALFNLLQKVESTAEFLSRLKTQQECSPEDHVERVQLMKKANPLFIPRNHRVEEVLKSAHEGDEQPFLQLHEALKNPGADHLEAQTQSEAPGEAQWSHKTFCGT